MGKGNAALMHCKFYTTRIVIPMQMEEFCLFEVRHVIDYNILLKKNIYYGRQRGRDIYQVGGKIVCARAAQQEEEEVSCQVKTL